MASEVLAVRVSVSGELLDATPIVIAKLNAVSEPVDVEAVLSDGDSFFIAWHRGIQGRFVTFSGSAPVLSPVIQFESTGDMPRFFAFDGSKYVVAYVPLTGSPFDRRLYFKRFSSADVGTAVPVAYQASDCGNALGATGLYSLASNGKGESLVVYSGQTSAPGGAAGARSGPSRSAAIRSQNLRRSRFPPPRRI